MPSGAAVFLHGLYKNLAVDRNRSRGLPPAAAVSQLLGVARHLLPVVFHQYTVPSWFLSLAAFQRGVCGSRRSGGVVSPLAFVVAASMSTSHSRASSSSFDLHLWLSSFPPWCGLSFDDAQGEQEIGLLPLLPHVLHVWPH